MTSKIFAPVILLVSVRCVSALGNTPAETYYLHELVDKSEQQVQMAKELVEHAKSDSQSLEKASQILKNLSRGLDKSIQAYQGTHVYEAALLQFQAGEVQRDRQKLDSVKAETPSETLSKGVNKFQDDSVKANLADLETQEKLAKALQTAEPAFVPKLQTQAQLGAWQASTRVSSQLTQLLSTLDGLRTDLHGQSGEKELDLVMKGMMSESRKMKQGALNVPR